MRATRHDDHQLGGFGTLDEKGRISLPKPIREALGVTPGSALAYIVLDGTVLLVPQDAHLSALMDRAAQALTRTGITVQDLLDDLPQARAEVVTEAYGEAFMRDLAERHRAYRQAESSE